VDEIPTPVRDAGLVGQEKQSEVEQPGSTIVVSSLPPLGAVARAPCRGPRRSESFCAGQMTSRAGYVRELESGIEESSPGFSRPMLARFCGRSGFANAGAKLTAIAGSGMPSKCVIRFGVVRLQGEQFPSDFKA